MNSFTFGDWLKHWVTLAGGHKMPAKTDKRPRRGEEDDLPQTADEAPANAQVQAGETSSVPASEPMRLAQAETGAVTDAATTGAAASAEAGAAAAGSAASSGAAASAETGATAATGVNGGAASTGAARVNEADIAVTELSPEWMIVAQPLLLGSSSDTTAPTANFGAATDNVGSVTGALTSGATTDDTSLVLSGTNESGSTVNVYNGDNLLGAATVSGTTWSYTATVVSGTTYQFNVKETDAAGNTSAATSNFTVIGDTTAPTANFGAATDNVGSVTGALTSGATTDDTSLVLSGTNESGSTVNVYNGDNLLGAATINGTAWSYTATVVSGTTYQFNVKETDAAGNTSAATSNFTVIGYTAGQSTIDLGTYGKLIAPVNVDGKWYYAWDMNGDGAHNSSPASGTNYQRDYTTHNVLDGLFNQNIGGTTGGDGNTNNTYRYATLNGVRVALPTIGKGSSTITDSISISGTAIDNNPAGETNTTYDDLAAIWDAHNGTGTGTGGSGTPSGWQNSNYWSATPSSNGHAGIILGNGLVFITDDSSYFYVALEVL
jgi:hypothetical protein